MSKNIYLLRHAQGFHNVDKSYHIFDPYLTQLGHQQVENAKKEIGEINFDLILVSPLRRTLQTATLVLPDTPMLAVEEIREHVENPCDFRCNLSEFEDIFSQVDFCNILERDPFENKLPETHKEVHQRASRFLEHLKTLPQKNILLVTHQGFIKYFIQVATGKTINVKNCELTKIEI